ncbi:hypothetical protein GIB67_018166 [Kingdonia uniflora]|uniref:C2 domain-containing protein n=1 Tax=Kingdonia uniflora TaxID=39325 RepID=A0A7J7NMG1_9MAGN|nr:hypothetical protein GIB67_018166 [Kingdonia uniflora]
MALGYYKKGVEIATFHVEIAGNMASEIKAICIGLQLCKEMGTQRSKYELQEFLKPSLRIISFTSGRSSLKSSLSRKLKDSFRISDSSKKSECMVEFIGLLKVKVIKGTNLAVRDILSSDPYVVLKLGKQKTQTQVISSNLNPIWNKELVLSVPEHYGALKLVSLRTAVNLLLPMQLSEPTESSSEP